MKKLSFSKIIPIVLLISYYIFHDIYRDLPEDGESSSSKSSSSLSRSTGTKASLIFPVVNKVFDGYDILYNVSLRVSLCQI